MHFPCDNNVGRHVQVLLAHICHKAYPEFDLLDADQCPLAWGGREPLRLHICC